MIGFLTRYLPGSLLLLFVAVAVQADLAIEDAYVRGMPPGQSVTAAFMRLSNPGEEPLTLVRASSSYAASVEIHAHSHDDGVMRMRRVPALEIAADDSVTLAPGGLHLMFMGLQKTPLEGDKVDLELCGSETCWSFILPVKSVINE